MTDARLGSLLATFPTGFAPDALFMSRRSLEQLREPHGDERYGRKRSHADPI